MNGIVFVVLLGFMLLLWIILVLLFAKYEAEQEEIAKADQEFNKRMKLMCIRAIKVGVCPENCEKCSYNLKRKNGVVEMRGKNDF
jgi:biotin synthase-like enzyme